MEIIPAVDIRNGRCVRLIQGRFDQETVFADDPVQMALHWQSFGVPRLHVVDLDGAKSGQPQNVEIIARIVEALDIPVQLGGGIRNIDTARQMLEIGVDRIVIGTSAALDEKFAETAFSLFGEQVVLGIDAREGLVAVHGWQEILDLKAVDFALKMQALGARRIIHTDIGRDGMLEGVNFHAMEEMTKAVQIPVIASGGVTTIGDIYRLKKLEAIGLEGVIIGKAIYVGALDLHEALAVAESS